VPALLPRTVAARFSVYFITFRVRLAFRTGIARQCSTGPRPHAGSPGRSLCTTLFIVHQTPPPLHFLTLCRVRQGSLPVKSLPTTYSCQLSIIIGVWKMFQRGRELTGYQVPRRDLWSRRWAPITTQEGEGQLFPLPLQPSTPRWITCFKAFPLTTRVQYPKTRGKTCVACRGAMIQTIHRPTIAA